MVVPDPVSPDAGEGPSVSSAREVVQDAIESGGFGLEPRPLSDHILAALGEAGYEVTRLELSGSQLREGKWVPVFHKVEGDRDE